MPGWKRDIGRRLDVLVARNAPKAQKAVKWNSPFYGIEDKGWFIGVHCFTHFVRVASSTTRGEVGEQAAGLASRANRPV
jgi:hypothetical protein